MPVPSHADCAGPHGHPHALPVPSQLVVPLPGLLSAQKGGGGGSTSLGFLSTGPGPPVPAHSACKLEGKQVLPVNLCRGAQGPGVRRSSSFAIEAACISRKPRACFLLLYFPAPGNSRVQLEEVFHCVAPQEPAETSWFCLLYRPERQQLHCASFFGSSWPRGGNELPSHLALHSHSHEGPGMVLFLPGV